MSKTIATNSRMIIIIMIILLVYCLIVSTILGTLGKEVPGAIIVVTTTVITALAGLLGPSIQRKLRATKV